MKLFIQAAAEQDILGQVEWYAEKGLVLDAIDALLAMPSAAPPRPTGNPRLAGLRAWPVKDFDEFWVYYLVHDELLTVMRVLHDKRDVAGILSDQDVEEP